jgi:hypothetical protein
LLAHPLTVGMSYPGRLVDVDAQNPVVQTALELQFHQFQSFCGDNFLDKGFRPVQVNQRENSLAGRLAESKHSEQQKSGLAPT